MTGMSMSRLGQPLKSNTINVERISGLRSGCHAFCPCLAYVFRTVTDDSQDVVQTGTKSSVSHFGKH